VNSKRPEYFSGADRFPFNTGVHFRIKILVQ